MSIKFTQAYNLKPSATANTVGDERVTVDVWVADRTTANLEYMVMNKLLPVMVQAYGEVANTMTVDDIENYAVIATVGEEVVGGMLLFSRGCDWTRTCEMRTLKEAVLPEYQGRGVGTALFSGLKAWLTADKETASVSVESYVDNEGNEDFAAHKAFMLKQGFELSHDDDENQTYTWDNEACDVPDLCAEHRIAMGCNHPANNDTNTDDEF